MLIEEAMEAFTAYVDNHEKLYKDRLAEAVAIPSISAELEEHGPDILRMIEWTARHVERLGGSYEIRTNPAGETLPPILMADFPVNPSAHTVCVYGHLDVQPAQQSDGWDTDPFVLTEMDGKLFGRGSTDDKGPALSWLWVIEAHQELGIPLPVNIKLLYEGMEENGSEGIFDLIQSESKPGKFLSDVDYFCISDNYWLGKTTPCITYGLRGLAYFCVTVQGCAQDLHSGVLGGTVHEAMTDLMQLLASLIDSKGNILIEGIMDDVKPVTKDEEQLYESIDFNLEEYKNENHIMASKLMQNDVKSCLMHRWRYPTVSIHGIEGAFSGVGAKTVIPAKVIGKFSMRLVPDQDPTRIEKVVKAHVEQKFAEIGSPNVLTVEMLHSAKPWLSSTSHPNYEAAAAAIMKVFGKNPDYTREGGSIPIASVLEDCTGMNVLLLPIGACDDMAHSQNEKYNISNMMNGIKVLGMYLHELGKLKGPKPSACRCEPLTAEELAVPGAFLKGFRCKCEF